jgi:hypothetical protein
MPKPSEPVADIARYGDGSPQSLGFTLGGQKHGSWEFLRKDGGVIRASSTEVARSGSGKPSATPVAAEGAANVERRPPAPRPRGRVPSGDTRT